MYCKNCGANIPDDSAFCVNCGTSTQDSATQTTPHLLKIKQRYR